MALFTLTFTTGIVDALSWLGLNGVFTANMTGNVLIIGMGAVGAGGAHWLPPTAALVIFLLGTGTVGFVQRRAAPGWSIRTTVIFTSVGLVVATVGILTLMWPPHRFALSAYLVMGVVAFGMGVQGGEAIRLAVPHLITVAVSSTVAGLGVSLFLSPGRGGGTRDVVRRVIAIVSLAAGAVVGSLLLQIAFGVGLIVAGALAAAITLTTHAVQRTAQRAPGASTVAPDTSP